MSVKYTLVSTVLFFTLLICNGQIEDQPKVYASPEALKKAIVDTRYNNPEKAFTLAEALLDHGIRTKNKKTECEAYHQLGKISGIKGENLEAIDFYNEGIEIAKEINYTEYLVELLVVKGNSFYEIHKDSEALSNYLDALKIAKQESFNFYKVLISTNIALLKQRAGKLKEAITLYKQSLDIAKEFPNENPTIQSNIITNIMMNIGEAYLQKQMIDSALYFNKAGLKNSLLNNDLETSCNFLKLIGISYYRQKEYDLALEEFQKAELKALELGNHLIQSEIYFYTAKCLRAKNETDSCIQYFLRSIDLMEKQSSTYPVFYAEACKNLADIYKDLGNTEMSVTYFEKYISENNDNQDQKLKVIEELHANDIQGLQLERDYFSKSTSEQRMYTLASLILLGILILTFVFFFYQTKKRRAKNQTLVNNLLIQTENEKKHTETSKTELQIKDKKVTEILKKLDVLEANEFYLNKECNSYNVAQQVQTNTTYLSKIVNSYKGKNFNAYINELRINYAIEKIKTNKTFRSYSIKSMATEIGYKSADSFSKYFKARTDLYPSTFIKSFNKIEEKKQ